MNVESPRLVWQKVSYKTYAAYLGPLRIEVKRITIRGARANLSGWRPSDVLGCLHHGEDFASAEKLTGLEEAQAAAEELAARYIVEACEAFKSRIDEPRAYALRLAARIVRGAVRDSRGGQ